MMLTSMAYLTNHEPLASLPREEEVSNQGIDLLDIALVLARDRRRIALATVAACFLGAFISFILKPTFTASAIIMPPQQQQSSVTALMGQVGMLLGGGSGLGLKSPADIYVGILESRTIADHIIAKFNLMSVYKTKRMEDTRAALKKQATFEAAKNGLINITVQDHDPNRASAIANAYIDELHAMNATLTISEAGERRVFFDQQLAEEKAALAAAEGDLKSTQERTGIISLGGQAESIIRSIAEVEAEISDREVQMNSIRTFATDENPDVVRLKQEIVALRQQVGRLENDQQHLAPGDTELPAGRVPAEGLEYARKVREVKYHEAFYDLLSRQYEAARIDEAKSAPIIQVIDRATPPDKKSGPHRLLIMLGASIFGFCVGCLWVFCAQALARIRETPESAIKIAQLESVFRTHSRETQVPSKQTF
jgi:tyrosine-protein kinase Etk/Wzc